MQMMLLTLNQTAEILHCSVKTVRRFIDQENLPAVPKHSGRKKNWLIIQESLEQWVLNRERVSNDGKLRVARRRKSRLENACITAMAESTKLVQKVSAS
jgi:hypothetical protein